MQIALVGLGKMGGNMVKRLLQGGHEVVGYDRDANVVATLAKEGMVGASSLEDVVSKLKGPRAVWVMVPSGAITESTIKELAGLMSPNDIIIDGGNSNFMDSQRHAKELEEKKIRFLDAGTSGGIWGLKVGYCLMVGGDESAYKDIFPALKTLAPEGGLDYFGKAGAGHYVKMVHNGIEYADMQLIAEAYDLLKNGAGLTNDELHAVFTQWNEGDLDSFLIEITAQIFAKKDDETGDYLVDRVLDRAAQKGTGKWTVQSALDLGIPVTAITEAVFARGLSSFKEQRVAASKVLPGPTGGKIEGDRQGFIDAVRDALYASKVVAYAQGFEQMLAAAHEHGWHLHPGEIATIWRGGCIIRARFLDRIKDAYDQDPDLANLLLAPYFTEAVKGGQDGWRRVVGEAARLGIPIPAFSSALAYYDGYRRERLPANLIQAQRDLFGAHTYERTDKPGAFHSQWAEEK